MADDSWVIMCEAFNKMRAEQADTQYVNYSWIDYVGMSAGVISSGSITNNSTALADGGAADGPYVSPVRLYSYIENGRVIYVDDFERGVSGDLIDGIPGQMRARLAI